MARRRSADRPSADREADVVVVGAGLAGLVAARAVKAAGASVVVVEARDRVGGRTLNHDIGDGKVVEVGGQWVGPTQHRMLALAREVGVETFPTYDEGENVIEWRRKLRRDTRAIPPLHPAGHPHPRPAQFPPARRPPPRPPRARPGGA